MKNIQKKIGVLLALVIVFTSILPVHADEKLNISVKRIGGENRYITAIETSKDSYPEKTDNIILASGENYADALVAGTIAAKLDGPVLLTKSKELESDIEKEIDRLSPKNIYIIGGENSVSSSIFHKLESKANVSRLAGKNRYETSVVVANELIDMGCTKGIAYASGNNYADALSGGAFLAKLEGYSLILTNGKELPAGAPISENNIIFGGPNSIDIPNLEGDRYWGENKYETSMAIAKAGFANSDKIVLVKGTDYPDGLSAIQVAIKNDAPIILTAPDQMSEDLEQFIKAQVKEVIIVGGEDSISEEVVNKIKEIKQEEPSEDKEDFVEIPDANLLKAINANIAKDRAKDEKVTKEDIKKVTKLQYLYQVDDLTGLEFAENLNYLDIDKAYYNNIEDFDVLKELKSLETLYLNNFDIKDLSFLSEITSLKDLSIGNMAGEELEISDISPIKNLVNLERLTISDYGVEDISDLANLTKLNNLILDSNKINNIDALSDLKELTYLDLNYNKNIENIEALKELEKLEKLNLCDNKIENISSLSKLTKLKELNFKNNNISDIEVLSDLTSLEILYLNANNIDSIEALKTLVNLTKLEITDNHVADLKPLENLTKLNKFNGSNNRFYDLSPLGKLEKLDKGRGYAKELVEVDVEEKEFSLPEVKDFDSKVIDLVKNEESEVILYEVINSGNKNQPKVDNNTQELIETAGKLTLQYKDGKYILPEGVENGMYAAQWFVNYHQWGTFILKVNLSDTLTDSDLDVEEPVKALELTTNQLKLTESQIPAYEFNTLVKNESIRKEVEIKFLNSEASEESLEQEALKKGSYTVEYTYKDETVKLDLTIQADCDGDTCEL